MCPAGSQLTHTGDGDTAHPTPEGPGFFQGKPEEVDAHPDTAPAWSRTRPRCLLWGRIWEMLPSPTVQMPSMSNGLPHKQFHWLQRFKLLGVVYCEAVAFKYSSLESIGLLKHLPNYGTTSTVQAGAHAVRWFLFLLSFQFSAWIRSAWASPRNVR